MRFEPITCELLNSLGNYWQRDWQGIGASGSGEPIFQALINRYCEPHRHYHTVQHLIECLDLFNDAQALIEHPAEVALAIWFHDSIYDIHRNDNELKSAEWAKTELLANGVGAENALQVQRLILATQHSTLPVAQDEKVLIDIDLAILGAPTERFAEYEAQIRAEYSYVPGWLFKRKRRKILQGFLQRPTIYSTEYFASVFESPARSNITLAIGRN
ncbi:MAG: N-methyl-D-aspartate receptor NMDAR2C subunit [Moraxellaceae bacterium]|nr:MAG: N-methyl-D-aspartate receptor NMDAR2C subunit [Moraxellaceae bacterium]